MYSVYILHSERLNKFYIGYSSDPNQRLCFHNSAINHIWTKGGQPWELYFTIDSLHYQQAIRIEKHLKKMKSSRYLRNLLAYPELSETLKKRFR